MRCVNHPGREATIVCAKCGQSVCGECTVKEGLALRCRQCAGKAAQKQPLLQALMFLAAFSFSWIFLLRKLSEITVHLRGLLRESGQTMDDAGLSPPMRFALSAFDTTGAMGKGLMVVGLLIAAIATYAIYRSERRSVRSAISLTMFVLLALIALGYRYAMSRLGEHMTAFQ